MSALQSKATRLVLSACLVCAGCVGINEACTLIGCASMLTVQFTSPPTIAYHLEAVSIENGAIEFDCPDPAKCPAAQLDGYAPEKVVLTVTTARGSVQYNLSPHYTPQYPNGQRCGAACRTGSVTVALP